eukprot:365943-Chlamydomonas_euryale.AAC.4
MPFSEEKDKRNRLAGYSMPVKLASKTLTTGQFILKAYRPNGLGISLSWCMYYLQARRGAYSPHLPSRTRRSTRYIPVCWLRSTRRAMRMSRA